jgi:AraC-like DNA-binding protein
MLQLEGSTLASQARRSCRLNRGDFCLIDGVDRFEIEVTGEISRVVFLQFPRHSVLSRQPGLESRTAEAFGASEPGAGFLLNVLLNLLDSAPFLNEEQRAGALAAVVQLLAVPKLPGTTLNTDRNSRRTQAALAFIDERFSDSALTANQVAHSLGVCRRRLDQVLLQSVGTSLSAQIWTRRLTQAASDLLDSRSATKTVTQIAFGAGFEDGAHFTRAFKRKYHCTPSDWRLRAGIEMPSSPVSRRHSQS